MVDDQDGDVGRQALDDPGDEPRFARRHAGGRLVEQQHLGREAERHGDLDQALAAIGERVDRAQRVVGEVEGFREREGLLDDAPVAPGRPQQIVGDAFALGDRQRHVFERA